MRLPVTFIQSDKNQITMSKTLNFEGKSFPLAEYESVLDCLLRNQQAIPYACKAGTCQACLVKTIDCEATAESRKWLKQKLQDQGYTLACQWVPEQETVSARLPFIEEFSVEVSIHSLEQLNPRTLKVLLDVTDKSSMFHYRPGQYLSLINPAGIARSYSIANSFEEDQLIELHISDTEFGIFTRWLFSEARVGDTLHIRGPAGDCFYADSEDKHFPMLLAGTGTGLAPLYGIVRDALARGHQGPMTLLHGGRTADQLYYINELQALAQTYPQLSYYPCAIEADAPALERGIHRGALESILDQEVDSSKLGQTRVYLCGNPDFVHKLRKRIYLKGAKSSNIHCDPFTERVTAATASVKAAAG